MPVVTLQSFKMIDRLEVGKLMRGPQILQVLNVFMRQMELHVKWHFFRTESYIIDFWCSLVNIVGPKGLNGADQKYINLKGL